MAKTENTFDIEAARKALESSRKQFTDYLSINPSFKAILDELYGRAELKVVIFAKSVAFRIGRGSIKSIKNYPSGFKAPATDIVKDAKSIVAGKQKVLSKDKTVALAAAYFLLFQPSRVTAENDPTEAAETEQVLNTIQDLKKVMKDGKSVTIILGKERYEVDNFVQVSGRPKADAVFTYKNVKKIYCSLKKGAGPGNFQQYGGWASDLGLSTRSQIKLQGEFEDFVQRIENVFEKLGQQRDNNNRYDFNSFKKGSNFATYLRDGRLANKVMFGKEFGDRDWGLDNCQILIDGDIKFVKVEGGYTLEGSYHTKLNPLLETQETVYTADPSDTYTPALFIYKSESQGLNQGGFSNARAVVWPNNSVIRNYIRQTEWIESQLRSNLPYSVEEVKRKILKEETLSGVSIAAIYKEN